MTEISLNSNFKKQVRFEKFILYCRVGNGLVCKFISMVFYLGLLYLKRLTCCLTLIYTQRVVDSG